MVKVGNQLREYQPEDFYMNKIPDRAWFFNGIATTCPGLQEEIIEHANLARYGILDQQKNDDVILATDEWANLLTQTPFHSSEFKLGFLIVFYRKERAGNPPS